MRDHKNEEEKLVPLTWKFLLQDHLTFALSFVSSLCQIEKLSLSLFLSLAHVTSHSIQIPIFNLAQ